MAARFVLVVGLTALLTSVGPASPATHGGKLAFAIEFHATQTLSWSVDETIGAPVGCVEGGSSWDFLVPARGGGELDWTFTASADTFGRRLTAPAQKLAGVSTDLFLATKDPLPVIWHGQVWFYDREDSIWRQES